MWEPPFEHVDPPPGDAPLVLVAPSTAQDPYHRLLRAALEGLADEPVRVLATWNRRPLPGPARVAANTRLVEWVSYSQTMPGSALVICHAGHGTLVRALASGCRVAGRPARRRHGRERRPRRLGGRGVRLPWPLLHPRTLRLAVGAPCRDRSWAAGRRAGRWVAAHPGPARAADLVEELATDGGR